MKKYIKSMLLVLVSFVISFIVLAPARLVYNFLPATGQAQLAGVSGTIWSGQASQLSWQNQVLGKLKWTIQPLQLFKLRLGGHFNLSSPMMNIDGNATINRKQNIRLTDSRGTIAASAIPLPPSAKLVKPLGKIDAEIGHVNLQGDKIESADIKLVWKNAAITEPMNLKIGEILLDINGENGDLNGQLSSAKNNPINLSGNVDILQSETLNANIKITPTENTPDDIQGLLPLIGHADQDGAVTVKYSGKISL